VNDGKEAASIPQLEIDDLHFYEMEETQPMIQYLPGGYHPIVGAQSQAKSRASTQGPR